jgi:hypothetical protein
VDKVHIAISADVGLLKLVVLLAADDHRRCERDKGDREIEKSQRKASLLRVLNFELDNNCLITRLPPTTYKRVQCCDTGNTGVDR